MADEVAAAPATPAPAAKKAKKAPKAKGAKKAPAAHPKFSVMITAAVTSLKERKGSSRQAILKYITANYKIEAKKAPKQLKVALKRAVTDGVLTQVKGTGASGSFKLPKVEKATKPKKAVKKPVKKPSAKKAVKKTAVKKVTKAKKPAKKSIAKKPKAAKKPAKKPAAKKAAKKPAAKKAAKK